MLCVHSAGDRFKTGYTHEMHEIMKRPAVSRDPPLTNAAGSADNGKNGNRGELDSRCSSIPSALRRRGVRRGALALGLLVGLWLCISWCCVYFLTRRARPPFAEPAPAVSWGTLESLRLRVADGEQIGAWQRRAPHRGRRCCSCTATATAGASPYRWPSSSRYRAVACSSSACARMATRRAISTTSATAPAMMWWRPWRTSSNGGPAGLSWCREPRWGPRRRCTRQRRSGRACVATCWNRPMRISIPPSAIAWRTISPSRSTTSDMPAWC